MKVTDFIDAYALDGHTNKTKDGKPQRRWDGSSYIVHPRAVAEIAVNVYKRKFNANPSDIEINSLIAVGKFHDLAEDCLITTQDIKRDLEPYAAELSLPIVIEALDLLNKFNHKNYAEFVIKISMSSNLIARAVKIADITHNLSDSKKEGSMTDKYRLSLYILNQIYENSI